MMSPLVLGIVAVTASPANTMRISQAGHGASDASPLRDPSAQGAANIGAGESPANVERDADHNDRHAHHEQSSPVDAPALIPTPAEASLLAVLAHLAAVEDAVVLDGINGAARTKNVIFDEPLRWLLEGPHHHDAQIRARAAMALAQIDWPRHAPALLGRIDALARGASAEDPATRRGAIEALGSFATPAAGKVLGERRAAAVARVGTAAAASEAHVNAAAEVSAINRALARMSEPASLQRLGRWVGRGAAVETPIPADTTVTPGEQLVGAARALLAHPTAPGTHKRIATLARGSDPGAVRPLLHLAARYGDRRTRLAALAELARTPLATDVPLLSELLDAPQWLLRLASARALAEHRSTAVATILATRLMVEAETGVIKAIAAALREQETAALMAALLPVVRAPGGYGRQLAIFLVRERDEPATLWPRVLAYATAPSATALAAIQAVPASQRLTALLPHLQRVSDAAAPAPNEIRALLLALDGVGTDDRLAAALLTHIRSTTSAPMLRSIASLLADQGDASVVPHLEELLADPAFVARRPVYELLLRRKGVNGADLLRRSLDGETDPELRIFLLEAAAGRNAPDLLATVAKQLDNLEDLPQLRAALDALTGVADPTLAARYRRVILEVGDVGAASSALERLLELRSPAPLVALRSLIADYRLGAKLRLRAIEVLGSRGSPTDIPLLEPLTDAGDEQIRSAAREALHDIAPDDYPLRDEWGRYPLVAAAAGFGASLFWLPTRAAGGEAAEREVLLGVGGGIVGGTVAFLLTLPPRQDVSLGEAGYFTSLGSWSTFGGFSLARISGLSAELGPEAALWTALGFEAVGIGVGAATLKLSRFTPGDVLLTNLVAASWGMGLIGGAKLARLDRSSSGRGEPGDVFALGGLIGAIPMLALSPRINLDGGDIFAVATTTALGAWLGAFAPHAIADDADDLDVVGGIALGQAVGLTGGLVLSALTELDVETALWGGAGLMSGAGAGIGLGMLVPKLRGRPAFGMLELGSLAGGGLLAWLGPHLRWGETDAALVSMMATAGAIVGGELPAKGMAAAGIPSIPDRGDGERFAGGTLLGGSVGLWTGLATAQLVDLSRGELALTGTSGALLGLGAGGLALMSPDASNELFSSLLAAGTALGAIGTALAAPHLRYDAADAFLGASTATLGATFGAMTPIYWAPQDRPLPDTQQLGGAMLGATVGYIAAGAISQVTEMSWQRVLKIDLTSLGAMAFGAGIGLVTPDLDARVTVALMQIGAVVGYGAAFYSERHSAYRTDDKLHLGLGAAAGAAHAWLIPFLWRDDVHSVPTDEIIGGTLVGAGVGALATRLLVRNAPRDLGDLGEVALFDILGSALGGGVGLLLADEDHRLRLSLLTTGGLLGFGLGEWLAPLTEYSHDDAAVIAAMAVAGGVGGLGIGYLPPGKKPRGETVGGGALLGAGAAALGGMALTQLRVSDADDAIEMGLVAAAGSLAGFGSIRARRDSRQRDWLRGADIGWFTGAAVGLALAPYSEFSNNDVLWMASASGVGAWVGAMVPWAIYGPQVGVQQGLSAAAAGASFAGLATAVATQFLDPDPLALLDAGLFATAATLVDGGLARVGAPVDERAQAGVAIATALGGFGLGMGLALGDVTDLDGEEWGFVATTAALGAWHGAWIPAAFGDLDERGYQGGLLAGIGGGALVGYGISQVLRTGPMYDLELLTSSAVGSLVGGGLGLMLDADAASQSAAIAIGSLVGLSGAAWVGHLTDYEDAVPLLLAGGLWGAWQGAWLGPVRATSATDAEGIGGGAMLGAGTGLALSMATSQLFTFSWDEVIEGSIALGIGNLIGAGVGLYGDLDHAAGTAVFEGAGLAAALGGLALAQYTTYAGSDFGLIAFTTATGTLHGAFAAGLLAGDTGYELDPGRAAGGALIGAGVGMAGGMLLSQWLQIDPLDLVEMSLLLGVGDAIGAGVGILADLEGAAFFATLEAGGIGATAAALVAARLTDFDGPDRLLTTFGGALGTWLGGWTPVLWQPDGRITDGADVAAGMLVGVGVGSIGAGIASQLVDFDHEDVGEIMLASVASTLAGAGFGMLVSPDDRALVGAMQGASLLGTTAAALFAKDTEYSLGDAALGSIAALYGIYQGAGLSLLAGADNRVVAGGVMLGGAAGMLAGMYLAPYIHLDPVDVLMLSAGSAWGVWLGIWTTAAIEELAGTPPDIVGAGLGTTAILTDVALVATSFGISEIVDLEPLRFAWISIAGGVGLLVGVTISQLAFNSYAQGLLWGTVGGLTLGTVLTGLIDLPGMGAPAEVAGAPPVLAMPGFGLGSPLLPQVDSWFPSLQVTPAGGPNGVPGAKGQQVLFTVTGLFH